MSIKFTDKQQLHCLERVILPLIKAIVNGMVYDPGHSDLDAEQPIYVSMTLGDYRSARSLLYELEKER